VAAAVSAVRACGGTHAVLGAVLTSRPSEVARVAAGKHALPPLWVVRVLGIRLLAQGLAELARPTAGVLNCAAGVDAIHALSMIGVAATARHRRVALVSGAVAGVSAALTAWTAVRLRRL
jgi:hypothetical protein